MNLAIIAGTGLDEMVGLESGPVETISTRFGEATVASCRFEGSEVVFLPRHGIDHSVPPARINYRAQIAALKKMGVCRVIGVSAVGSLRPELPGGSFAVLEDFIDLTKRREDTFFGEPNGEVVHTDFTLPYCPEISAALINACAEQNAVFEPNATYVGVEGPRYESPAEVRLYGSWGAHVVGMTNLPEVVLAREAGLCYGAIAVVSNLASGLSPAPLVHDEVRASVLRSSDALFSILRRAIASIPAERECACGFNTRLLL